MAEMSIWLHIAGVAALLGWLWGHSSRGLMRPAAVTLLVIMAWLVITAGLLPPFRHFLARPQCDPESAARAASRL
jgi:hypothetical protein